MTELKNDVIGIILGRWRSQVLYSAVKLGVFDDLAHGPKDAIQISRGLTLDLTLAYRLLRANASLGVLHEGPGRVFSLSAAGEFLRKDHPETPRGVALLEEGPEHYALWNHLPQMVRDGKQNAFVREFGRMAFDHAAKSPEYAQVFNEAMSSYSATQTAWTLEALAKYDFAGVSRVCDVGGGQGHLLCSLLVSRPGLSGSVLELESVIKDRNLLWADKMGVAGRCMYAAGSMFESVPPADLYMMKMIIHDWNDAECIKIFSNCAKSASRGGRVLVVENVVPGPETPHFAKLFDIHMTCWGTGRERTVDEHAALLEKSGWRYVRAWYPASHMIGVIEGRLA